jgi:hypothetical protein
MEPLRAHGGRDLGQKGHGFLLQEIEKVEAIKKPGC